MIGRTGNLKRERDRQTERQRGGREKEVEGEGNRSLDREINRERGKREGERERD